MEDKHIKILVIFVEPMLYNLDLIHEVYEKTPYEFQYVYCNKSITGRDQLTLPKESCFSTGSKIERKHMIKQKIEKYKPEFVIINGYVGIEQRTAIWYCRKNKIPYAIESDTPLHIPKNKIKALLKKLFLDIELKNKYCYGFPGGTLQKENLIYYGIQEEHCYIMPMSVSEQRLIEEKNKLPTKDQLKAQYNLKGKKVLLFVGRLEEVKNVSLLIKAFGILRDEKPELALVIVGDGTEITELKQQVLKQKTKDVYFMGYSIFPKLVEFYKLADVFVLPSVYEPWGLVVNEASILGLPVVVSTDVGCKDDLVNDGYNGYAFQSENTSDLVDKLKKSLVLGEPKYKVTDDWNYERYLNDFLSAMEKICINQ